LIKISEQSNLRIRSITLKNYRTFYGEKPPIELSVNPKLPVTVIHGISGRGKTTLLNAVHWCIYGQEKKDTKQKKSTSEGLVHSYVIDTLTQGKENNTFVRVIMENELGEIQYEIERQIIVKKISSEEIEVWNDVVKAKIPKSIIATSEVTFAYKDPDTDELIRTSSESNVKERLESIFPEILSSYILFDAELLKQFESQKEDVLIQEGIQTITGLPIVNSAIENIDKENKKTTRLGVSGKLEFQNLMQEVERYEKGIKELENENADSEKKVNETNVEIEGITKFLINHDDEAISNLESQKEDLRIQISTLADTIETAKTDMKITIFDNLFKYYLRDSFILTESKFEEYRKKGLIPSHFTKEALQGLLNEKECVCGRPLSEHEQTEIDKITNAMNRVYEAAIGSEIGRVRDTLNDYIHETDENSSNLLANYDKLQTTLAGARVTRSEKKSKLVQLESETDQGLQDKVAIEKQKRTQLNKLVENLNNSISRNKQKLDVYQPKFREKKIEFEKMKKYEVKDEIAKNKIALCDYAESILKQTSEKLLTEFKSDVESATQEYFLNTAPQKEEFAGVKIDDENFTISALRKSGKEKEISQGQAHCLGLSYIAGIRKVTRRNYFMMIDSPFHNVSQDSKLLVCVELPTKMDTTQVTFFTTDTEYRSSIKKDEFGEQIGSARDMLKSKNLVGIEYNLVDKIFAEINGEPYRDTNVVRIG
jgi:DNA sulfur modification protein DndD